MNESLRIQLIHEGYTHLTDVPGWGVCGIIPMLHGDYDLCLGMEESGVKRGRLRFDSFNGAVRFLTQWDGRREAIQQLLDTQAATAIPQQPTLGATGDWPDGQLNENDEGGLVYAVGIDSKDNIIIDFGKPVRWIGMAPQDAIQMAQVLIKNARQLASKHGEILKIEL